MSRTDDRERLLDRFPPPSLRDWEREAARLLRGRSLRSLVSSTLEGIDVRPLYRRADVEDLPHVGTLPGLPPYVRGARPLGHRLRPWLVAQELALPRPQDLGAALTHDLPRGQGAVVLVADLAGRLGLDPDRAPAGSVGAGGTSLATLADLREAVPPGGATAPLRLDGGGAAVPLAALAVALLRERGIPTAGLRGCLGADPLAELVLRGGAGAAVDDLYDELAALTRWALAEAPRVATVAARGWPWHDGGAGADLELGLTVAAAVEHLRRLQERGLEVDEVAPRLELGLGVGTHFFMELAKLRAARLLWSRVVEAAGGRPGSARLRLHCRTSPVPLTVLDAHTNLLRGTVAALAAVLGGCDSLHVQPFDAALGPPGELARRLARNTQLILREESHLDRVVDAGGGSWYLERLTAELAGRAWERLQAVERAGGLAAALAAGLPQRLVGEAAARRRDDLARRREVLVGVTRYADPGEVAVPPAPVDPAAVARERAERVAAARDGGGRPGCAEALAEVAGAAADAARGGAARFAAAVVAAAAGATLGELTVALRGGAAAPRRGGPPAGIGAIAPFRAAAPFESLRLAVLAWRRERAAAPAGRRGAEEAGEVPQVHLACLGSPERLPARLDFVRGLFQVAGLLVGGQDRCDDDPRRAAAAALAGGAPLVCLVAGDEDYPRVVPGFLAALAEGTAGAGGSVGIGAGAGAGAAAAPSRPRILLAGRPAGQAEALAAAGVDEFIAAGDDALAFLTGLARRLGVPV